MRALQIFPDEPAFVLGDPRRGRSDEVDLGATWRAAGSGDTWRLAWLRDTGELYACRNDSLPGSCSDVRVLAVLTQEADVDALLTGWRDARDGEDGLAWLAARASAATAA